VRASYDFDLALRDLVTEALEVLEVDVRAAVAYTFGQRYGAFGHVDPGNFYDAFDHAEWLQQLQEEADRSKEQFIEHFRSTYAEYPDLPIWIAMEILSFGALSKMFHGMLWVCRLIGMNSRSGPPNATAQPQIVVSSGPSPQLSNVLRTW